MAKNSLETVTDKIRLKGYSYKIEKSYSCWVKRFVVFHHKRHPSEMGRLEIEQFLTHFAVERKVSPSTQNQAFNALIFLYEQVLNIHKVDLQEGLGFVDMPWHISQRGMMLSSSFTSSPNGSSCLSSNSSSWVGFSGWFVPWGILLHWGLNPI